MPKSRGRKPKKSQRKRNQQRAGRPVVVPRGDGWGELEPWARAMVMVEEAEARGDARGALDVIEAFAAGPDGRYFWRPWRTKYLLQLTLLGSAVPAWVTSRWMCHQALQCMHDDNRDRGRRALDLAVDLHGGSERFLGQEGPDALARLVDHDWAYRQLFLHDLGGLEFFASRVASSTLLEAADDVDVWARTPVGGYRLVATTSATVTWLDLATGDERVTPDIGSAVLTAPGEHVIGRLVPSGAGEHFDVRPLLVPESVARAVAADPPGWFDALAVHRRDDPDWHLEYPVGHVPTLFSDVTPMVWRLLLLPADGAVTPYELDAGAVARAVLETASLAMAGEPLPVAIRQANVWPCLAAAILDSTVISGLAHRAQASDVLVLEELSTFLAEPAASACRYLALEIAHAA